MWYFGGNFVLCACWPFLACRTCGSAASVRANQLKKGKQLRSFDLGAGPSRSPQSVSHSLLSACTSGNTSLNLDQLTVLAISTSRDRLLRNILFASQLPSTSSRPSPPPLNTRKQARIRDTFSLLIEHPRVERLPVHRRTLTSKSVKSAFGTAEQCRIACSPASANI